MTSKRLFCNPQRVVVKVFRAGALDDRHDELDIRALLQIREHGFEALSSRGIDYFGEIIYRSLRLGQPGVLRARVPHHN